MATVLEGICADGSSLNPMIIYKCEEFLSEWFDNLREGMPLNILFGRSHNGWTDERMALRYLATNFGPGSESERKAGDNYRLLLFDGHSSHVTTSFLSYCLDHKIIPCCLPPHTTHRLQPLDVSIFSPYKNYYRKELGNRFAHRQYGVSKNNFYEILAAVRPQAFSISNIQSGFWFTGLCPVDRTIILRNLDWQLSSNTSTSPPIPSNPSTPPPYSRDQFIAINPERIAAMHTPRNRSTLHQMRSTIESGAASNSPYSWRLRHLAIKGYNAAECLMIENSFLKEQNTTFKRQLEECKVQKRSTRTRIPDHGIPFMEKEDIEKFDRERQEAIERKRRIRQERAEKRINKLENELRILERKKRKRQEMEDMGKSLPKNWHSVGQLTEEENTKRRKLEEIRREIVQSGEGDSSESEDIV